MRKIHLLTIVMSYKDKFNNELTCSLKRAFLNNKGYEWADYMINKIPHKELLKEALGNTFCDGDIFSNLEEIRSEYIDLTA